MNAADTVKRLIREARFGALATLDKNGAPYASLVAIATDPEGRPTLLISRLARHTQNLAGDQRASLLVSASGAPDPLNAGRASVQGRIAPAESPEVRARYLARHAAAAGYVDFPDFGFFRLVPEEAHLVEGFGRIVDVKGEDLLTDWTGAQELAAGQEGAIAHMNEDHKDAISAYATGLLSTPAGDWRLVGLDPEGCEIASGDLVRRLPFPQRVTGMGALRQVLVALTKEARRDVAS